MEQFCFVLNYSLANSYQLALFIYKNLMLSDIPYMQMLLKLMPSGLEISKYRAASLVLGC